MTDRTRLMKPGQASRRRLREEPGATPQLSAYDPGTGQKPLAWPGDEQAPFVQMPPIHRDWVPYRIADLSGVTTNYLPVAANEGALEVLSNIDVRGEHRLTLAITFYTGFIDGDPPVAVTSTLALVPYGGRVMPGTEDIDWYPIGVVDPVLRGTDPTIDGFTSIHPPEFAYRNCYSTQLNLRGMTSDTALPGDIAKQTLVFDVAPYELFRFGVGIVQPEETDGAPTTANLTLYHMLQR